MKLLFENFRKFLNEEELPENSVEELETIVGELHKASDMHKSQAERIEALLKSLVKKEDDSVLKEKKNCGCGQDPCKTYGKADESLTLESLIKEEIEALRSESNFFDNMRAKQKRCKGKPKTGDCAEDRPSKKQWKKITAKNESDRVRDTYGSEVEDRNKKDRESGMKDLFEEYDDFLTELENDPAETVTCTEFLQRENLDEKKSPAWQRKAGKNKEGGLNAKGRKSYEKENPGSDLKPPVSKKTADKNPDGEAAGRRKGFCSRMCGMKDKNTGEETKNDPDSRINKSLRKWDCNC